MANVRAVARASSAWDKSKGSGRARARAKVAGTTNSAAMVVARGVAKEVAAAVSLIRCKLPWAFRAWVNRVAVAAKGKDRGATVRAAKVARVVTAAVMAARVPVSVVVAAMAAMAERKVCHAGARAVNM